MKNIFWSECNMGKNNSKHESYEYLPLAKRIGIIMTTCCLMPFMAVAQEQAQDSANQPPADEYLEEVIVTGTASNYKNSVLGKRSAEGIVDMLDTDELGRLPDKNIGETLNRIPGVSMLLEKGQGRFVQIRGISPRLNNVTINGMQLGSVDTDEGGRAAPLDVIGGEMLSGVQVMKTPTPDMDGTGIGGTLNLTTKQPFDYEDDFTLLGGARVGNEGISSVTVFDAKEVPWSVDLTMAGKTKNGKVGWITGGSYSNRKTPLLGIFQDDWRPVTFDPDPNVAGDEETFLLPGATKNNVTVVGRERLNLNGMLEFRPTDESRYYVRGFYAKWNELQFRGRYNQGLSDNVIAFDGDRSGTVLGNRVQTDVRSEPTEKVLFSVAFGGENVVGPWTVDYTGQYNDNKVDEPNDRYFFRSGSSTFGPDAFVIEDNGLITVTSGGPNPQDPALQNFRRVRFDEKRSDEETLILQLNIKRDIAASFEGVEEAYIKFGAKFSDTDRTRDDSRIQYDAGDVGFNSATDPSLNGGAFTNPVPIEGRPNLWLDFEGLGAFFDANKTDTDLFDLNEDAGFRVGSQNDFKVNETVLAGYIMGKVDFGKISVIGGVRIERTEVDTSAFTIVDDGTTLSADPISDNGSYTNVLPSIILTAALSDEVLVRAGYSKALGRPDFDSIAPRSSLDIEDDASIGTVGTLSIGNPKLKARESNNFDLSLEWYFDEGSLLSVAFFYKDISNEIIGAPTQRFDDFTFEGQFFDRFEIDTTINAQSASIKGVEFTFVDTFEFLPAPFDGLGFAGSVTLLDSSIKLERNGTIEDLPLFEQADSSISLTAFYQKGPLDISVTYNRNDNFLTDLGPTREFDLDQGAFERIDARIQYSINDSIKLFLEGINLNDEPTTEFQGGDPRLKTEYEFAGRTISIGFVGRF